MFNKKVLISIALASQIFANDKIINGTRSLEEIPLYRAKQSWSMAGFIKGTEAGIYSYSNLEEFLPTSIIDKGTYTLNLEKNIDKSILETTIDGVTFGEYLKSSPVAGLVTIKDGMIQYENYQNMEKTDNRVWMSNAKILAGLSIAQLEEKGLIDVQNSIDFYMPELKDTKWSGIKIINILNQASGLDIYESREARSNPNSGIGQVFASEIAGYSKQSHIDVLFAVDENIEQGRKFEYSSANTQMLGLLVESVSGMKLGDYIEKNIWRKIGADSYSTLALTPDGAPIIHGLLSSRLIDMAKLGMTLTPSWDKLANEEIFSNEILDKIQTRADNSQWKSGGGEFFDKLIRGNGIGSSYQFDIIFENGDLYKSGMNGQGIYISPKNDFVAVWYADAFSKDLTTEAFIHKYSRELKTK